MKERKMFDLDVFRNEGGDISITQSMGDEPTHVVRVSLEQAPVLAKWLLDLRKEIEAQRDNA